MPNGIAIGVGHKLVEIGTKEPIDDKYDIFAYLDVLEKSWLGMATMLKFLDNDILQPDVYVNKVFARDDDLRPILLAHFFGPVLNDDGSMKGLAFIKDPDGYWIEILGLDGMKTLLDG